MVVIHIDPDSTTTAYVTIGNSDDGLSQQEWSEFHSDVMHAVKNYSQQVYGVWLSEPSSPFQNACWGFRIKYRHTGPLETALAFTARFYRQESIAVVYGTTRHVKPLMGVAGGEATVVRVEDS